MKQPCIVSVYRSAKEDGMYLIVEKSQGLKKVPEALLKRFGPAKESMAFLLTETKKLARFDAKQVLDAIRDNGFFLQLPPPRDEEMADIALKNSKLQR
ncbi:YcgL domain-containing protein [Umboniibacter marinipuniceus]|uniref:YcgL domain-containing protein DFR27_2211 n=1 Tax=Umboniibacter marinipuniceus TaxID=569599 RepID=A0A3M0A146_9GAMM|nr:YcgL domain-containing protein [Umboniibacter marinipuniceus]RMA78871.1 hypothetical protein DFR27_2211 [Umboniibacter marinipuniceus]